LVRSKAALARSRRGKMREVGKSGEKERRKAGRREGIRLTI
jgi:hypothetical protein